MWSRWVTEFYPECAAQLLCPLSKKDDGKFQIIVSQIKITGIRA